MAARSSLEKTGLPVLQQNRWRPVEQQWDVRREGGRWPDRANTRWRVAEIQIGIDDQRAEQGVIVPALMMSVLTMITVIRDRVQPEQSIRIAVGIGLVLVIMIRVMNVKAQSCHILPPVTVDTLGRRPGELERNEQHEEDGKDATHGGILLHESSVPHNPPVAFRCRFQVQLG